MTFYIEFKVKMNIFSTFLAIFKIRCENIYTWFDLHSETTDIFVHRVLILKKMENFVQLKIAKN